MNPVAYAPTSFTTSNLSASITNVSGQNATIKNYGRAGNVISITGSDWAGTTAHRHRWWGLSEPPPPSPAEAISRLHHHPRWGYQRSGSVIIGTATKSFSIPFTVLGTPTAAISPAPVNNTVSPGTQYNVCLAPTWNPLVTPSLLQGLSTTAILGPPGSTLSPSGTGTVNGTGTLSGTITITTTAVPNGVQLKIQAGQGAGPSAISATALYDVSKTTCTRQVGSDPGNPL